MKPNYVLAWDLGTSGAKVALIDVFGKVIGSEFEAVELLLLPGGGAEQRPEEWWSALCTASGRLLARELVPRASIAAVGVTGQWSGTVVMDAAGSALGNAIIWMDSRGARAVKELTSGFPSVAGYDAWKVFHFLRLCGGAPAHSGKDPVGHIAYLRTHDRVRYEKAHKFLEPKDYLIFRLTGEYVASFDSIAVHWVTDNRDATRIAYSQRLLDWLGLERDKLPTLCASTTLVGRLSREAAGQLGLPNSVQVCAGSPDVQSAAIGAGTTQDYAAHLYSGTSSWICAHVPHKKTDVAHNMAALPAAIPGRYLLMNEQECAGACLVHLRDKLLYPNDALESGAAPADVFQRLDRLAERAPPGSQKLLFLPWLYGERTPVEDSGLRGAFFNLSLDHERSHLVRSVLEGVAYNSRWLFEHVQAFCRRRIERLRWIGGGAESALWGQILADVLGAAIERVHEPRFSNLRGAAFIAFVALGELEFAEVDARVRVDREFLPRAETRSCYAELYAEFRRLHAKNRAIFRRLNASA